MEKEKFFSNSGSLPLLSYGASSSSPPPTWKSSSSEQLPNCFLNLNWDNSMDQSVPFESALSSIVSSPAASNAAVPSESFVIRELIGKLGSICNSGDKNSTNTSCYTTPLNSPPKLNLSMMDHNYMPINPTLALFSADPDFAERAARFSSFGSRSFSGLTSQFGIETEFTYRSNPRIENVNLPRVSIQDGLDTEMISASASASASGTKFSRLSRSSTPDNAEFANSHEESSAFEQIPGGETSLKGRNEVNTRKRKAVARGKAKDLSSSLSTKDAKVVSENDESNRRKGKLVEDNGNEKDDDLKANEDPNGSLDQKQSKDKPKLPEPPKDYIHVRARRGQATDSHSLAERVRREKISKRMKFLQDLVPGCNKITGKAVMLDEIINYVESLQRQVELLSMKLATVNPRLDFNMESLLSKEIIQSRGSLRHTNYPLDPSVSAFPYGHQAQQGPPLQSGISNGTETQCSVNPLDAALHRNLNMQFPPVDGFREAASQLTTFWEDDLQSVVQMGFDQNQSQETTFQSQSFHGSLPAHMKIKL